jgi:glycosyltransferase involved in cell wall biosynthesis
VEESDKLVLWNGGVWDWLEPEPLVRAVGLLADSRPDLKLIFMGVKNPDQRLGESAALGRVRRLTAELGLEDRVIFNDWVPYDQRADFLLEAAVGACLYPPGLETDYSFRTRLLDLIWTGRPILCSDGDDLGALAAESGLGRVVADHEPETVAQALDALLRRDYQGPDLAQRAALVAEKLTWPKVIQPLARFCARPAPAPDKAGTYPSRPQARFPLGYYGRRVLERWRNKTLFSALRDRWRYRGGL